MYAFNLILHATQALHQPIDPSLYNLNQANFNRMRELLQAIDWNDLLSALDIYLAWELFSNMFTERLHASLSMYPEYFYDTKNTFIVE